MQDSAKRRSSVLLLAVVMAMHSLAPHAWAQTKRSPNAKAKAAETAPLRTKIAEGKYELKRTDGKLEQSFEEPWTLYKTNIGYELEEQWVVSKDPSAQPMIVDIGVNFAPGLYPIQLRVGGVGSSKQLNCRMEAKEFACESRGTYSQIAMQGPYNLFSPSPWMLGSIARRAKKVPQQSTKVQLVQMMGMSDAGPKLESFEADVQYVGEDQLEVDGTKMDASIVELKAKSIPGMLMWLSPDGVVLALQDSSKADQRMELVKFTKFAKF
ncbi:MAG: hypothetical protein JWN45_3362 [Acidobacteriaceae bacterium]|nr:hypothetical protein [Acidobacteriaceae bacterium]